MSSTPSRGASAGPWSATSKRQPPGPRRDPAHTLAKSVPRPGPAQRVGDGACAGRRGPAADGWGPAPAAGGGIRRRRFGGGLRFVFVYLIPLLRHSPARKGVGSVRRRQRRRRETLTLLAPIRVKPIKFPPAPVKGLILLRLLEHSLGSRRHSAAHVQLTRGCTDGARLDQET